MMFTFKRDANGEETIHVGDILVAKCMPLCTRLDGEFIPVQDVPGVDDEMIVDAIERADEAGFWRTPKVVGMTAGGGLIVHGPCFQVTVEVPSC